MPARNPADSLASLLGLLDQTNLLVVTPSPPTFGAQYLHLHSHMTLKMDLRSNPQPARRIEQGGPRRSDTLKQAKALLDQLS